jgi:hypothetical protein
VDQIMEDRGLKAVSTAATSTMRRKRRGKRTHELCDGGNELVAHVELALLLLRMSMAVEVCVTRGVIGVVRFMRRLLLENVQHAAGRRRVVLGVGRCRSVEDRVRKEGKKGDAEDEKGKKQLMKTESRTGDERNESRRRNANARSAAPSSSERESSEVQLVVRPASAKKEPSLSVEGSFFSRAP